MGELTHNIYEWWFGLEKIRDESNKPFIQFSRSGIHDIEILNENIYVVNNVFIVH